MATQTKIQSLRAEVEDLRKRVSAAAALIDDPALDPILADLEAEKENLLRLLGP